MNEDDEHVLDGAMSNHRTVRSIRGFAIPDVYFDAPAPRQKNLPIDLNLRRAEHLASNKECVVRRSNEVRAQRVVHVLKYTSMLGSDVVVVNTQHVSVEAFSPTQKMLVVLTMK